MTSFVMKDCGQLLWRKLVLGEVAGLDSIPLILQKTDYFTKGFLHGFRKIAPFKILEYFLQDIFANSFLTKLQCSSLQVAALMKTVPFDKKIQEELLTLRAIYIVFEKMCIFEC